MNIAFFITQLAANAAVFRSLLENTTPEMQRLKPQADHWCLLEVVCHLLDEENEDFRARMQHIWTAPQAAMPRISPTTWVQARNYLQQNFEDTLHNFLQARSESIRWLQSLDYPNWEISFSHPALGEVTPLFFLQNWLAHDYLHQRQIIKLKYLFLQQNISSDLAYAGTW
ncbi:MAG: DinB family protein [Chitinophagales bacterium]|nr:DinB family protein [Bacteroidota bacterium]MCB9043754.1 DinB family protein [Chitinophagales bacterium]